MKACLSTVYFENLPSEIAKYQKAVVDKFNVNGHTFYQSCVAAPVIFTSTHGRAINCFLERNRLELGYDVLLFLDVDCIPLSSVAINYYLQRAAAGVLVGNIQRSNHIENNRHVYVAPSALAISAETYEKLGRPSALETERGDVCEEFTFAAEERGIATEMILPSRYDTEPAECAYWPLRPGMPVYGCGATFAHPTLGDLFWHSFQIWRPEQQDNFKRKCGTVLAEKPKRISEAIPTRSCSNSTLAATRH